MARYIDAGKTKAKISYIIKKYNMIGLKDEFIAAINNTPTADVKEAVPGEWVDSNITKPAYKCSICHALQARVKTNFCHCCGADMRGGLNED